jgi:hypothetical protein
MTTLKDAALRYATLGYQVHPIVSGAKRPLTTNGLKDATTDIEQLEGWWTKWPNANVAIRTDGLLVVDIDPDGDAWLKDDPDKRLELASGPTVITPRGGRHHYFRGGNHANSSGKRIKGVDTRANGGYVLAPPSIVNGNAYSWLVGLDCEPDRLPAPPAWLLTALYGEAPAPRIAAGPAALGNLAGLNLDASDAIREGQRNGTLTSLGGTMRRRGMSEPEILAALTVVNRQRCKPPLDQNEVEVIARSVARYEPDQVATATTATAPPNGPADFKWLTSAELAASDEQVVYLVDDVLTARQGGIIGGRFKSLKTGIGIDLAMSAATATPFLGRFSVTRAVPSGIMSAESGLPTLKERGIAIARSKGLDLADCHNLFWSTASPQLGKQEHLDSLRRFIDEKHLESVFVDPLYLALASVGDGASNLFNVGQVLAPLTRMIEESGCSIVLLHHARKHRGQFAEQYAPPELGELAFAGFAEWARFWVLVAQRRAWDEAAGRHWLWFQAAGSAGHAGLWHLDVTEGKPSDPGGRRWEVSIVGATEGQQQAEAAKEVVKEKAERLKIEADKQAIKDAARRFPDGETKNILKERSELRTPRFIAALNELLKAGELEECYVKKAGKLHDGYRLAMRADPAIAT